MERQRRLSTARERRQREASGGFASCVGGVGLQVPGSVSMLCLPLLDLLSAGN